MGKARSVTLRAAFPSLLTGLSTSFTLFTLLARNFGTLDAVCKPRGQRVNERSRVPSAAMGPP